MRRLIITIVFPLKLFLFQTNSPCGVLETLNKETFFGSHEWFNHFLGNLLSFVRQVVFVCEMYLLLQAS